MIIENFVKEAEKVDANVKKDVARHITDHVVDDIIHLIKHRKRKPKPEEKEIIYALKQGGIVE